MKVLYLAPLVPSISGSGGKRAIFNHLEDLARVTTDVDLMVVDIEDCGEALPEAFSAFRGCVYPRALPRGRGLRGLLVAAGQLLFDRRPRAAAVVASTQAREAVRKALRETRYDVVVVDHLNAASLIDGTGTDVPIQYIAHNIEADVLRDLRAREGRSRIRSWRLSMEIAKMARFESALLARASRVTVIAATDRDAAALRSVRDKTVVWPELPGVRVPQWVAPRTRSLLFVGSAAYFPNRDAIEWLVSDFMPALAGLAPDVVLRIAGTSLQDMGDQAPSPSVIFEGFVSSERLDELHRVCDLFICPVVLGSGIKIKVLEASGYGLPVAATRESLAGIDYLDGAALRIGRDGEAAARAVAAFLADPRELEAASARSLEMLRQARSSRAPLVTMPASTSLPSLIP